MVAPVSGEAVRKGGGDPSTVRPESVHRQLDPPHPRMIRSGVFPGGSLVRALFHRPLMVLSDRGGSSGGVGSAWGDHCARHLDAVAGQPLVLPDGRRGALARVVRLDTLPGINRFASRHGLSNPDFLLELSTDEGTLLAGADAKFSIETARSKQVSAEIVEALIQTEGSPIAAVVDEATPLADGLFLSPDFPLTHEVMSGRYGIARLSVRRPQVELVAATSVDLFDGEPTRAYIDAFAAIDGYRDRWPSDLMLGLYGLRSGAAAVGCWQDEVRPLLGTPDDLTTDPALVLAEIDRRAGDGGSGWELLQAWDTDAEVIRAQRVAVSRAAQLPMPARDLRVLIEREATRQGLAEPSVNYVRRQLATLTRGRLRERFGILPPPLVDEGATMVALGRAVAEMTGSLGEDVAGIVASSGSRSERPE